ncbi:MAG: hypothetical protein P8171_09250 [Candidatus Thiodiazotropha sp.]|jgi:biopolymer transport protein ExbD
MTSWNGTSKNSGALIQGNILVDTLLNAWLHEEADRRTAYEKVARAMVLANHVGLLKISFVIQPVEP